MSIVLRGYFENPGSHSPKLKTRFISAKNFWTFIFVHFSKRSMENFKKGRFLEFVIDIERVRNFSLKMPLHIYFT